jgi:hypothetical protein
MNIKCDENQEIFKCNNCAIPTNVIKTKVYFSLICLHRICEPCIKKVFTQENPAYFCKYCNKKHDMKDYSEKTRDEIYFEYDFRARKKIMAVYYKRPEDFDNEEEYDNYLEEIEDKCKIKVNNYLSN